MMVEQFKNEIEEVVGQAAPDETPAKRQYERSTIEFPYYDLNEVIEIVRAVHDNAGVSCSLAQLAAYMKQPITSGGFRGRVSNAGTFRLTENERGEVKLSLLGRALMDHNQEAQARANAFLEVPLYKILFEKYDGFVLPPSTSLEKEMVALGVAPKQADKARQAFARSALQAGFFAQGEDRLVMPAFHAAPFTKPIDAPPPSRTRGNGGDGGDGDLDLDPLIMALLRKIPSVDKGWPKESRVRWFRTFAMNVSQVYDPDDEPVELKIDASN